MASYRAAHRRPRAAAASAVSPDVVVMNHGSHTLISSCRCGRLCASRGINLLIADDVGLGKAVEAGLVARELLLRRRIDFIVIAAPASMTVQWKDALEAKPPAPRGSMGEA